MLKRKRRRVRIRAVSDLIKVIRRHICIFIVGIALGVFLLWVSFFFPHKPIDYHVEVSSYMLKEEGMYPWLISGTAASLMDNFTDAIMLSEALQDAPEGEELKYAMMGYYEANGEFPQEALFIHFQDSSSLQLVSYERYWHGYLFPLKLLLQRFSLQEIRFINIACQMMLIFFLYILSKRKMHYLFVPLLIGTLSLFPSVIGLSLQFSTVFYIAYGASALVLLLNGFWDRIIGGWATFFLVVGMMTSYFDFLTYPVLTLGLPLCFYFALKAPKVLEYRWIQQFVSCTFHWCLGYGGFWASKWIIGSILTGSNMMNSAVDAVTFRSSRMLHSMQLTLPKVIEACWEAMNSNLAVRYCVIFWMAGCVSYIIYNVLKRHISIHKLKAGSFAALPMILCALLPVGWYYFTQNHSYNHSWYTFRALGVTVFACTAFFGVVINRTGASETSC